MGEVIQLNQSFNYNGSEIRVVIRDGEPWFVAKDACFILELGDASKAVSRLDDEKGTNSIPTPGGNQQMLCVNEPGLYSLILGSRKPEAKEFKRWVTHEVLPTIRKTGQYQTPTVAAQDEAREKRVEAMLMNAQARKAKLMQQMALKFKEQLSPESVHLLLAGATEVLTGQPLLPKPGTPKMYTPTEIAKELSITPNKVGRMATKYELRTSEFGMWILDKARDHEKQVRNFLYNEKGKVKIVELFKREEKKEDESK